ncbi:MAG TPA: ATPase domain-containing protein [Tepidisphaeraceae bacterium]|nr:ATPase domain-containing protein [Tepidisphaeraceae bacterium]
MEELSKIDEKPVATGVGGLDDILRGGLTPNRLYLIEGNPGSGKTTLALQYLLEGVRRGERTLYVTLSETRQELLAVAKSHGWSLEGIDIHEMESAEQSLDAESQLTMFHPSELELSETTRAVLAKVEKTKPRRVVFDSLSEMRLLAHNPLRYRRQILGLKQFFAGRQSTVLLLDDKTGPAEDMQLQSIAHGVIHLEQTVTEFGAERRRLTVRKMRGLGFRGGMHDYTIRRGGLDVFPRLIAAEHLNDVPDHDAPTGNPALDRLLGGGLPTGSSTLLIGPAGIGKSSVALQVALAAAGRGERAALFIFDESAKTLRTRAAKLSMPLDRLMEQGLVSVQQVDPAELSPGEFISILRQAVNGQDASGRPAKVVMIDSLNGYLHSMSQEKFLSAQLHELFTYLSHRGVSTLVTVTQSGVVGAMQTPVDTTYLADNVLLFRYFEARGCVRRAISIFKKRSGAHEHTIREMRFGNEGLMIGEPLTGFQGVLTGVPTVIGPLPAGFDDEGTPPGGEAHAR